MDRLLRFSVGCALGAAGALLFSRKRGDEVRRRARARVRGFLQDLSKEGAGGDVELQVRPPAMRTAAEPEKEPGGPGAAPPAAPSVAAAGAGVAAEVEAEEPAVPPGLAALQFAAPPPGEPPAEPEAPPLPPDVADLRARVEETRQAVRDVLDRPFAGESVPAQPAEAGPEADRLSPEAGPPYARPTEWETEQAAPAPEQAAPDAEQAAPAVEQAPPPVEPVAVLAATRGADTARCGGSAGRGAYAFNARARHRHLARTARGGDRARGRAGRQGGGRGCAAGGTFSAMDRGAG